MAEVATGARSELVDDGRAALLRSLEPLARRRVVGGSRPGGRFWWRVGPRIGIRLDDLPAKLRFEIGKAAPADPPLTGRLPIAAEVRVPLGAVPVRVVLERLPVGLRILGIEELVPAELAVLVLPLGGQGLVPLQRQACVAEALFLSSPPPIVLSTPTTRKARTRGCSGAAKLLVSSRSSSVGTSLPCRSRRASGAARSAALRQGRLPERESPPAHVREWRTRARMRETLVDERTTWLTASGLLRS